jgi:hypothetical protein
MFTVSILFLSGCLAAQAPDDGAKKAQDGLQGTWDAVALEEKGEKAFPDVVKKENFSITIKGNELTLGAFKLCQQLNLNFIGNVEGHDLFKDHVDVVVCDGFVGNVVLKTSESLAVAMFSAAFLMAGPMPASMPRGRWSASAPAPHCRSAGWSRTPASWISRISGVCRP